MIHASVARSLEPTFFGSPAAYRCSRVDEIGGLQPSSRSRDFFVRLVELPAKSCESTGSNDGDVWRPSGGAIRATNTLRHLDTPLRPNRPTPWRPDRRPSTKMNKLTAFLGRKTKSAFVR